MIREAKDAGAPCPDLEETEACNTEECPGSLSILLFHFHHHIFTNCGSSVDCKVDDWSAWSDCDVACGRGTKTKTREVIQQPKHGGETCPALEQTRICNADHCPGTLFSSGFFIMILTSLLNCGSLVDCKVGPWRAGSECSATCGGGSKTMKREVVQEPEHGGETCPALEETMVCNTDECPGNPLPFHFFKSWMLSKAHVDKA